jgi:hypothetical protein
MYKDKLDMIDTILILKDGIHKFQETIASDLADIDGPSKRDGWNNPELEKIYNYVFKDLNEMFDIGLELHDKFGSRKHKDAKHTEPCGRDEIGVLTCDACLYEIYEKEVEEIVFKTEEIILSEI